MIDWWNQTVLDKIRLKLFCFDDWNHQFLHLSILSWFLRVSFCPLILKHSVLWVLFINSNISLTFVIQCPFRGIFVQYCDLWFVIISNVFCILQELSRYVSHKSLVLHTYPQKVQEAKGTSMYYVSTKGGRKGVSQMLTFA